MLFFEDKYSKRKEIGNAATIEEALKQIAEFLKKYNYKSYYIRYWKENNETIFDFGSHSEFFILI